MTVILSMRTLPMDANQWKTFMEEIRPELKNSGFKFYPYTKEWKKFYDDAEKAVEMQDRIYRWFSMWELPKPVIEAKAVEEKKPEPEKKEEAPKEVTEALAKATELLAEEGKKEEAVAKEVKQETIVPKAEHPRQFYIIANVGQFHYLEVSRKFIYGKFKLYTSREDVDKLIKDGQFRVLLAGGDRSWADKEPEGEFIFKPAGEDFKSFWKRHYSKLRQKYLPGYLKRHKKKLKAKALAKFSRTAGEGEWFYDGMICPEMNSYFSIREVAKLYNGHFYTLSDILDLKVVGNDLYVKIWDYTSVSTLDSWNRIENTEWYRAGILSAYWFFNNQKYSDEPYARSFLQDLTDKLSQWKTLKVAVPKFRGKVLPHQYEALQFLKSRGNALLAMDIGTGKTLVSMLHALRLFRQGKIDKCVIFANITVKYVWEREFKKWLGDKFYRKNVEFIEGFPEARTRQWRSRKMFLIANYEQAGDRGLLKLAKNNRVMIIADECTHIKNITAKRTKNMMEIPAVYKIGLSGEPLERSMKEIHTIERWLDTKIFDTFADFKRRYMGAKSRWKIERALSELHHYLQQTIMYRKTMYEVAPEMPRPQIIEHEIDFQGDVLADYNSIIRVIEKLEAKLDELERKIREAEISITGDVEERIAKLKQKRAKISRSLLAYFKIAHRYCDHPRLLSKENSQSEWARTAYKFFKARKTSPKLEATLKLLSDNTEKNNKVVIFTEYEPMAEMIADTIERKLKRPTMVMTGKYPMRTERGRYLEKFEKSKRYNILVMTDVGKFGLNMPYANHCLIYDLPWNSTTLKQRIGRLVRLGKTAQTIVFIPYVKNLTVIEQRVRSKLDIKSYVISQVIDGLIQDTTKKWLEGGR